MISASEEEMKDLLSRCVVKTFRKKEFLSEPGTIPQEIFFLVSGLVRVSIEDRDGLEHSIHFAMEHQFIADYSAFLLRQPSLYALQALEQPTTVVMPAEAVEWGYAHMRHGDRLGRKIAEFYFIYQDNRIRNQFARSVQERYQTISDVFPDIHNRVPQHMIASYLGITPVHLSRLKKAARRNF